MRILFLVLNQIGMGTYWRAYHLARQLVLRGHSMTLVATSKNNRFQTNIQKLVGFTIVESPDLFTGSLRSGWDPWNIVNRILWLRGKEFDLVHAFESRPTVIFPALYVVKKNNIPLFMDWADWFGRGGSVEERPNPVIRTILRPVETFFEENYRSEASGSTVICSTLFKKAIALGIPDKKILLLRNGADIEKIIPIPQSTARLKTGLPKDKFIIGYIGSMYHRDVIFMSQVLEKIRGSIYDFRLLLLGSNIKNLQKIINNPDYIIQTGYINENHLSDYLGSCDIFWLPLCDTNANRGRFPMKLTNYFAAARPTIATSVGDVTEIFNNKKVGLLSTPNPHDFSEKTLQLYQNPKLREEMGKNSRQLAEDLFQWPALALDLERFYNKILKQ